MKRTYVKPMLTVERFALDVSIAANCEFTVTFGPGDANLGQPTCKEFDIPDIDSSPHDNPGQHPNFYEGSCDCYYTAAGSIYFTS